MADIKNTDITNEMIKSAQNLEINYGIPTSVTLGQLIQESGGKFSTLASPPNYNLFGVKAFSSWKGETVTLKNGKGDPNAYSTYRKYKSYDDAFEDRGKLLTNSNYSQYTVNAKTPREYIQALKNGGYAEDENYVEKVMNVINDYNLTQYDISGGADIVTTDNDNYSGGLLNWKEKAFDILGTLIYFLALLGIGIFSVILFLKAFNISLNPKEMIKNKVVEKVGD